MKTFTLNLKNAMRGLGLVAVFGLCSIAANAQTFVYDGVIYKASGSKLTAQKPGTKVTVGEDGPTAYTGDIKIPATISYSGKDYTVISIGSVFKGSAITSIEIADGVATISRGCFQGCVNLVSAKLPSDLTKFNADLFNGCVKLAEITIPGTASEVASNQFKGCTGLKKLIIAEGESTLDLSAAAFVDGGTDSLAEVIINRNIGDKYTTMDSKPFRASKALEKVTIGGKMTSIPTSYFESATALKTVVFESNVTELGTNVFAGSGIENITLPAGITVIPSSTFQGCKSLNQVTLGDAVTSIQDMAFYNSTVKTVNFPATLKTIGQMAFSGTSLAGELTLPEALTSVGLQAFANNKGLTAINMPATLTTIGDGAFYGCTSVAKFAVAEGNEAYKTDATGAMLITADGLTLSAFAPASAMTAIAGEFTAVAPYAVYGAKGVTDINLPSCVNWGDYSLNGTSIEKLSVAGTIGRYVAANCAALKELTVDGAEVPFGIAANDAALTKVNLSEKLTTVKQDAFLNCTALENLNLGTICAILEADAFKGSGIKNMTVSATNPAAMAEGVFTAESGITVTVPVDLVDTYKTAAGWSYLNIVGDANLAAGPADMGMPHGLYYATPDGTIDVAYADGNFDTYDVGGVPHTFQLVQFKNRIYGASAGEKFVYSATSSVDGDGKLFYISKVGGQTFQAVVLDNTGNNAYKDPFGLYIYGSTLYVNDRNVCIRKISADAIALPQDYPSWVENNWLGFYGSPWSYGCIKAGWAITQGKNAAGEDEPVYWVGMKYNGNGIYRFREEHVGESSSNPGAKPENGAFLCSLNPIFTTFYIDEANGHMYIYIEKAGTSEANLVKGGLYRINLADLEATPDPTDFSKLNPVLIDGSPVKYEGSATNEHVGISQLSPDENGQYLYWCYRAPTAAEAAANEAQDYTTMNGGKYWAADKYDAENPLHHSGIKRIKLGEAQPTVEMVVSDVEGYGCIPVNYEGSTKPAGVDNIVVAPAQSVIAYANGALTVSEDALVTVYNVNGAIVAYATLTAGQSYSVEALPAGAYIATAGKSVVKFVK